MVRLAKVSPWSPWPISSTALPNGGELGALPGQQDCLSLQMFCCCRQLGLSTLQDGTSTAFFSLLPREGFNCRNHEYWSWNLPWCSSRSYIRPHIKVCFCLHALELHVLLALFWRNTEFLNLLEFQTAHISPHLHYDIYILSNPPFIRILFLSLQTKTLFSMLWGWQACFRCFPVCCDPCCSGNSHTMMTMKTDQLPCFFSFMISGNGTCCRPYPRSASNLT